MGWPCQAGCSLACWSGWQLNRMLILVELLLKKSQVSILQIQATMSKYFDVERKARGSYEWLGGDLKQMPGLGRQNLGDDAWVFARVPYPDMEGRTVIARILSPFSGTLYRVRLHNLDLSTTLAVVKELQGMGVDVGFVVPSPGHGPAQEIGYLGEEFDWPGNPEAELSRASELHKFYEENALRKPKREAEPPPYELCAGNPQGELCARCRCNTLAGGEIFCLKYMIRAER